MRDLAARSRAVNRALVEVVRKGFRHGDRIKTLQHLFDLCGPFSRRQLQMRCDNTPRLAAAAIDILNLAQRFELFGLVDSNIVLQEAHYAARVAAHE